MSDMLEYTEILQLSNERKRQRRKDDQSAMIWCGCALAVLVILFAVAWSTIVAREADRMHEVVRRNMEVGE